jgi:hypothetical protein
MSRYGAFALAALLCTAAVPSYAAWGSIGSVSFSMRDNHDSSMVDFRGDRIALTSHEGDVYCRDIEATFGNGRTRTIYRGEIRADEPVNVDLNGVREVRQLDFDCRPMDSWRARVDVAANSVGGFFGERFGFDYRPRFDFDF